MRVLVVGSGRSGTTWTGEVLGRTSGAGYISEPDNVLGFPFGNRAGRGTGTVPILAPGTHATRLHERLFDAAFGGRVRYVRGQSRIARKIHFTAGRTERRAVMHPERPRVTLPLRISGAIAVPQHHGPWVQHQVVKSTRVAFNLEWVLERWNPRVVLCRRHPLDVVASSVEMGHEHRLDFIAPEAREYAIRNYGVSLPATEDRVTGNAWRVALVMSRFHEALAAHPEFVVAEHEVVCLDPVGEFRRIVDAVGLEWSAEAEEYLAESNQPGTGYELKRVASEQSGKWRGRLSPEQAKAVVDVLKEFPIADWYDLSIGA